jgi:hypothetical protein
MKKIIILLLLALSTTKPFSEEPTIISKKTENSRIFENMAFLEEDIHFCLSLPSNLKNQKLFCIIVMAGLETGQKNLQYISNMGDYAFIGFEYPSIIKSKKYHILDLLKIRRKFLKIPKDILKIVNYAKNSPWSNKKVSIAGFSFGAMFVPAIYHLAQKENVLLGPGIIAYAGADLYPIFYTNFKGSKPMRMIKASIASLILKPLKPSSHLPYLKGDFLIINGKRDKNIPFEQAKKLQRLTPYPKTIVNLEEEHLGPETTKILKEINEICKKWMDEKLKNS